MSEPARSTLDLDASAGAGWGLSGVDRLVSIAASGPYPAGMLRVLGSGGYLFYEGTSTFTSEAGDNGTLTSASGGGLTTYTYSTPDGQSLTFDGSGYQTKWTSADGLTSIAYGHASGKLSALTAVDGTLNTITYTGATDVTFLSSNGRTTSLALSSGDLTRITNPDGGLHTLTYDASHRLTRDEAGGNQENNYAYTSYGTVGTVTLGTVTLGGVTNPTRSVVSPAILLLRKEM